MKQNSLQVGNTPASESPSEQRLQYAKGRSQTLHPECLE